MSMLHGSVTGDSTRVADDAGLTWIEDKATIDRLLASVLVLVEAENVAHPADEERPVPGFPPLTEL